MGFDDTDLSRVRGIANVIVAQANRSSKCQTNLTAKRTLDGASITLRYRSGTPMPIDPLTYLGDLADNIRNELRLERDPAGAPAFRTGESTFKSGDDPEFSFSITH